MSTETVKTVAWASSKNWRANQLMSAAQYESALPKNRTEFDLALVKRSDWEAEHTRAEQALRELVAVKALKWEFEGLALGGFRAEVASGAIQYEPKHARYTALKAEYDRRQPLAWAAARAIVDGEKT